MFLTVYINKCSLGEQNRLLTNPKYLNSTVYIITCILFRNKWTI